MRFTSSLSSHLHADRRRQRIGYRYPYRLRDLVRCSPFCRVQTAMVRTARAGVDDVLFCLLNAHKRWKGSYALELVSYTRHQLFRIADNIRGGQRHALVPID